jgi:hypothetical protein
MVTTQEQINSAPKYFDDIILKPLRDNNINAWVAGGAVRDYFMGVTPTDYDIFFPTSQDLQKCQDFLKSAGAEKVWESNNGVKYQYNGRVFDLVKRFYTSASDILKNFDFTVSMFATDGKNLWGGKTSFKDLDGRNIVINKVTNPDSTVKRVFKYFDKGFKINKFQINKLANQIKNDGTVSFGGATDVSGDYLPEDEPTDQTQDQTFCGTGQILVNGACVDAPIEPPSEAPPMETPTCSQNQILINNICVPLPVVAPPVIIGGGIGGGGSTGETPAPTTTLNDYTILIILGIVGALAFLSEK